MKKTYTRTMSMTNEQLQKAKARVYIYEGVKWDNPGEEKLVEFTGLKSWSIIDGFEAAKIETLMGEIDEYHEYLLLEFVDGSISIFRNSHTDMFIR